MPEDSRFIDRLRKVNTIAKYGSISVSTKL